MSVIKVKVVHMFVRPDTPAETLSRRQLPVTIEGESDDVPTAEMLRLLFRTSGTIIVKGCLGVLGQAALYFDVEKEGRNIVFRSPASTECAHMAIVLVPS